MASASEPKIAKNRVHLDVRVTGGNRAALTEQLVALGGSVIGTFLRFTVLADPEGNEVCLNDA